MYKVEVDYIDECGNLSTLTDNIDTVSSAHAADLGRDKVKQLCPKATYISCPPENVSWID